MHYSCIKAGGVYAHCSSVQSYSHAVSQKHCFSDSVRVERVRTSCPERSLEGGEEPGIHLAPHGRSRSSHIVLVLEARKAGEMAGGTSGSLVECSALCPLDGG